MLDVSPSNLYSEIQAAERFRDSHLEHYRDVINEYVGPAGPNGDRGETAPDNHVYEYLSLTIPRQPEGRSTHQETYVSGPVCFSP